MYCTVPQVESELWDLIFGDKYKKESNKNKERSRGRKYGSHALARRLLGGGGLGGEVINTSDVSASSGGRSGIGSSGGGAAGDRDGVISRYKYRGIFS